MLLKYFYDPKLAQASYMVGCQVCGEALVIDPARDITPYIAAAKREQLRITHVAETHIHADFVSGGRELAHAAGARLWLSDMGDADWKYQLTDPNVTPARDGKTFMVGNIGVEILHTPGHTPEHLVFEITDTATADKPMGIFTGDFLFVGDVGRPDLLETAAGYANTKEIRARQQFHNIQRFKSLPDYLQIWPGHGAGSACGKALGAVPSSTLGYEKLFNPAFHVGDEDEFVRWLLQGQPEAPRYFARMKQVNKAGAALLETLTAPRHMEIDELLKVIADDGLVIDARSSSEFRRGHIPGTLHVPHTSDNFSTYVGWYVDYTQPTYIIADEKDLSRLVIELRAIGVDDLAGYVTPEQAAEHFKQTLSAVPPREAFTRLQQDSLLLDVRSQNEYDEQHTPGAQHIPMGYILDRFDELPQDKDIIVQCGGGVRSMVVASLLQKHGFKRVLNLSGGIEKWERDGLPLETG
jgi:hydroxyacylglutathione hydrolase